LGFLELSRRDYRPSHAKTNMKFAEPDSFRGKEVEGERGVGARRRRLLGPRARGEGVA